MPKHKTGRNTFYRINFVVNTCSINKIWPVYNTNENILSKSSTKTATKKLVTDPFALAIN